jgi:signal transduction histidine kinase/CheY-like chemotaxis protein
VRARLMLAFLAIATFAILAAVAGLYAFREVGNRLEVVDSRVGPTLAALEISRSTERIIAASPALLVATERSQRDSVKTELQAEVEGLLGLLLSLEHESTPLRPIPNIEPLVTAFTESLDELDHLVTRRLAITERIGELRQEVFNTSTEVQRLLAPWIEIVDYEINTLITGVSFEASAAITDLEKRLASLYTLQRATTNTRRYVSDAVDMMVDASTTEEDDRLSVLKFQLNRTLESIATTITVLDPKLQALLLVQLAKLRNLTRGPDAITGARMEELTLRREGEEKLFGISHLSIQLTDAVGRLGNVARNDIGDALADALRVQHLSSRILIVLVILSILTSILIVWLYVGRNIVRRLAGLNDNMLAIAGGKLDTPVESQGNDEITEMSRAVEVFRKNAIELEQLLDERGKTAARLEQVVHDRTRELRDSLRKQTVIASQLETANSFKSRFLASASHDLRQPLHALNLFIARLHGTTDDAERSRLVDRIISSVNAMNELFESLLDMTRLEAGVVEPQLLEFPINRVLSRIETTFADAAREKNLRLSIVPSSAWVRSDPVLLERILLNLVSNAVHYTTGGGILVGCRRRGTSLRIDVLDSGPGIPLEDQKGIFAEYHQLSDTQSGTGGGLGLGLAIVERLGRLLEHEIDLDSRPGRGSRFSVLVQRALERHEELESPDTIGFIDPLRGKRVLVIDDDSMTLEGMEAVLQGWGCHVLTADLLSEALCMVPRTTPFLDLVICDYQLPHGLTGVEAIEAIRAKMDVETPAFLISANTAPECLRHARAHGLQLLHKPVSPMQLRSLLNRILRPPTGATQPRQSTISASE